MAEHDDYRVDLVALESGDTVRTFQRDYPLIPVSDESWQEATASYREVDRESGPLGCDIEAMRPAALPPLTTLISDEEGRVWVEAATIDGFGLAVSDGQGTVVGEWAMPDRDPNVIPAVRGDRLYVVTVDALGVQGISVFDVPRHGD